MTHNLDDRNPYQPPAEASGKVPAEEPDRPSDIFRQLPPRFRPLAQFALLLSIPMMGVCFFWQVQLVDWYGVYAIAFATLVVPVVVADSGQLRIKTLGEYVGILGSSFRLTSLVLWPLLLGAALNSRFWSNWEAVLWMIAIVAMTCLINAAVSSVWMFCYGKNWSTIPLCYATLFALYVVPPLIASILPLQITFRKYFGVASPISAMFSLPFNGIPTGPPVNASNLSIVIGYFGFSIAVLNLIFGVLTAALGQQQAKPD